MRYFVTFIIIALLLIFGIIIFKPGSKNGSTPTSESKSLPDYSDTGALVSYTTDGVINGDDEHRQIVITVGQKSRTIDIVQGYQGYVIKTKSYYNNESAYNVFLNALNNSGFTKERSSDIESEVGVCPTGERFTYELSNTGSNKTDLRLWSTTCGGGTQGGNKNTIQQLFQNQIDDYDEITANVQL